MKGNLHLRLLLSTPVVMLAIIATMMSPARGDGPAPIPSRHFEFTYQVTVPPQPSGSGLLRLWIPLPPDDAFQQISGLKIVSSVSHTEASESEYSDRSAYFAPSAQQAAKGFTVEMHFVATRREHKVSLINASASSAETLSPEMRERYLQPDNLIPLNDTIAKLSQEQTQGISDPLTKARKLYDYVLATMKYDKSGTGWGNGDAMWACTAKRGNCTDFHSLFIGMARVAGIPARFEIGFPLPEDKTSSDIPGYHCWAEFYLDGIGWVPIDASEGWKHPEKRDYFFGAHCFNRVQFSTGRDIRLSPAQTGDRLNYFVYPYAEVGGKPYEDLKTHFAFEDIPSSQTALNQSGN